MQSLPIQTLQAAAAPMQTPQSAAAVPPALSPETRSPLLNFGANSYYQRRSTVANAVFSLPISGPEDFMITDVPGSDSDSDSDSESNMSFVGSGSNSESATSTDHSDNNTVVGSTDTDVANLADVDPDPLST